MQRLFFLLLLYGLYYSVMGASSLNFMVDEARTQVQWEFEKAKYGALDSSTVMIANSKSYLWLFWATTSSFEYKTRYASDYDAPVKQPQPESPYATCDRLRDSLALVALYRATNGPGWTDSEGWLTGAPLEEWFGVTITDECVTGLRLGGNRLSGSIPSELGQLSLLQYLILRFNQLSGSIPRELGQLNSLRGLYLNYNQLSGVIPCELGQLDSLKIMALEYNQLSGSIPSDLGLLVSLEKMHLSNNQLSSSIPSELGQLGSLEELYVFSNELSGPIPTELSQLNSLKVLSLNSNSLSGNIPSDLGQLSSLENLELANNDLSGSVPIEISQLGSLERLWLSDNQLTGCIPTEVLDFCATLSEPFFRLSNNPKLPFEGDCLSLCNGQPQIGAPCDDGNPTTQNDRIQADCTCGCPALTSVQMDTMLCMGDTLRYANEVITTESGRYELLLPTNLGGCDSLQVTWFVEVIGSEVIMERDTICEGTVLDWRGLDLRETGTYGFTETTVSGNCDTLFQLDLLVLTRNDFNVEEDTYELVSSNNPIELGLLENDSLPYLYELDFSNLPEKGNLEVVTGSVLFTPDGISSGADSFMYEICLDRCPDFCKQALVRLNIEFDCVLEVTANTPNGFTPNDDGKNDKFDPLGGITGECLDQLGEARLGIRNIQSELVFETRGIYQPWTGDDPKGRKLPVGTYFYILEVAGLEEPITGAVEIIR